MAWSDTTAGFLIQTGIDADFSGLSGLTGVTVTTQGNKQLYTIATDRTLRIDGTLSGDGEFEEIITTRQVANGSNSCIVVNGTWNAGVLKANPGGTVSTTLYTKGTIWRQTGNITSGNWFNGGFASGNGRVTGAHLAINDTGTLNLNGSTFAGPMMITIDEGATVNSVYDANIISDDTSRPAGEEWNCRYYKANINLGTVDQQGGIIQLEAINSSGNNKLTIQRSNAGIGAWSQSGAENLGGTSFDPSNPGTNYTTLSFLGSNNVVDFAQYANQNADGTTNMGATRLQNCPQGTDLDINGGETAGISRQDNWGYTWMTREIATDINALASPTTGQQGAFYIKDYDESGNDRSPSTRVTSIDDSPDAIYFGLFNGSLSSLAVTGPYAMTQPNRNNAQEVLIAVNNLSGGILASPNNPNRIRATKNTGIWKWDQRAKSLTVGDDPFDVFFWSYENNPWTLEDNLSGGPLGEAHTYSFLTLPDTNITNDRLTIDALNTSLGTNFVVANTSITTGTVDVNLDQVYDVVKYKKETSVDDIIIPTTTTLVLDSDGSEIDVKALTLTQGTGKWTVGSNHTKIKHNSILNAGKFTLAGNIELTATTLSDLPTTVGTSTLNPTNIMTSTGSHTIGSGSIINGSLTISGNGNDMEGTLNGTLIITDTDSEVNTINGTVTGSVTTAGSGLHTMNGNVTSFVTLTNGSISADSNSVKSSTITAAGTGDSLVDGTVTSKVTLGNASTKHTVGADISANGLDMGTGSQHLVSGSITGAVSTTGTISTSSTYLGSTTIDATGTGDSIVNGTSGGKVTLANATTGHTVGATISGGGLDMGTGAHTVTGSVTGAVATTGSLTTGLVYSGSSTINASGTGDSTIAGTSANKVTLGNATTKHTVSATIQSNGLTMGTGTLHALSGDTTGAITTTGTISSSSIFRARSTVTSTATGANSIEGEIDGLLTLGAGNQVIDATLKAGATLGNGAHTIDGTLTGPITTANGNTTLDGQLTGNLTDGTGTLTFGGAASMTGTLTKSGSTNSNSLTLTVAQAGTIDLVVTTGTLEIFGPLETNEFKSITGNVSFNPLPSNTTFVIEANRPSGRVIFKNRTTGVIISDGTHTLNTLTTLGTFINSTTNPISYDIYYKPTNTTGTNGVFYQTTIVNANTNSMIERVIGVTVIPHADILIQSAKIEDLTGLVATMSTVVAQTTADINLSGATSQISSAKTQALFLRVTDDANYLNLMANNNTERDFILPSIQSGTEIDQSRFTIQATDQQSVTALAATGTGTLVGTITIGGRVFAAVFIFPNPAGLSQPEARQACIEALERSDLTQENVEGIIAQNTTIPAANQADLNARRVTRENMNNLGILAPINDNDPE